MDKIEQLLKLQNPAYRRAYSDRTCWLMACLAEFAYIRFNPSHIDADKIGRYIEKYATFDDENKARKFISFLNSLDYDHDANLTELKNKISKLKLELINIFDKEGTQAILVGNEEFLVLAFRGTEATSMRDIKADIDAISITCESGGKIHRGFNVAYGKVAAHIERTLSEKGADRPLFITGHSLGGALATVAAKKLNYGKIAACYTFGAPRVGTENWVAEMKTPVYRIVNAADCVTMLPPAGVAIEFFGMVMPDSWESGLLKRYGDYMHGGNMRYLTSCDKGRYDDVQLLYSMSFLQRMVSWWTDFRFKKFLADHSITVYRKKLEIIACRRNDIK